jgi:hypothetical protein
MLKTFRKADKVTDWEVNWSKPLLHLFKGKSVLIGDAAHSVSPRLVIQPETPLTFSKDASINWPRMLPRLRRRRGFRHLIEQPV